MLREQLEALESSSMAALPIARARAARYTRDLGLAYHLPVIDLALPAIKATPDWDEAGPARARSRQ